MQPRKATRTDVPLIDVAKTAIVRRLETAEARMPLTRLDEIMTLRRMSNLFLVRAAGVHPSDVSRYRSGARDITVEFARKVAGALAVHWSDLMEPHGTPLRTDDKSPAQKLARRIEATRVAAWGDNIGAACAALRIGPRELAAIEAGRLEPPLEFLFQLAAWPGVTGAWLLDGDMSRLDPRLAARIGNRFPDLLPDDPPHRERNGEENGVEPVGAE